MSPRELLQSDLTGRAEFVGTDDPLSTDERAEIHAREVLSASRTQTRVGDVARRMRDGTKPIVASQSPDLATAERSTRAHRGQVRDASGRETIYLTSDPREGADGDGDR
jgi:hypothetical protein